MRWLSGFNDDRVRMAQLSHPTMSFEEMLDVIVQQLRIHPVGKGKLASLQALRTFVADPASTDRVILIFDEALVVSHIRCVMFLKRAELVSRPHG
jgi:hypothetical protein